MKNIKLYEIKGYFRRDWLWEKDDDQSEWTEAFATSKDAAEKFIHRRLQDKVWELLREDEPHIQDISLEEDQLMVIRKLLLWSDVETWSYRYESIDIQVESETTSALENMYIVTCLHKEVDHKEELWYDQSSDGIFDSKAAAEEFCRQEVKRRVDWLLAQDYEDIFWSKASCCVHWEIDPLIECSRLDSWTYDITELPVVK